MREAADKSGADAKKVAIFVALKIAKRMLELEADKSKIDEVHLNLVNLIDEVQI